VWDFNKGKTGFRGQGGEVKGEIKKEGENLEKKKTVFVEDSSGGEGKRGQGGAAQAARECASGWGMSRRKVRGKGICPKSFRGAGWNGKEKKHLLCPELEREGGDSITRREVELVPEESETGLEGL